MVGHLPTKSHKYMFLRFSVYPVASNNLCLIETIELKQNNDAYSMYWRRGKLHAINPCWQNEEQIRTSTKVRALCIANNNKFLVHWTEIKTYGRLAEDIVSMKHDSIYNQSAEYFATKMYVYTPCYPNLLKQYQHVPTPTGIMHPRTHRTWLEPVPTSKSNNIREHQP